MCRVGHLGALGVSLPPKSSSPPFSRVNFSGTEWMGGGTEPKGSWTGLDGVPLFKEERDRQRKNFFAIVK